MSTTTPTSAEHNGHAWGLRARDWSETESQMRPSYEARASSAPASAPARRVLDVGCGSGAFLRAAADHGAVVSGIDASEALLAIARERVPEADLSLGDLQHLPYADDSFDAVTGFNSFFFADDMVAALREAGRVAKPGAPVVIQVWGRPERFDLGLMKAVLARFRPPPPAGRLDPSTLWQPGVLEDLAVQAGLDPRRGLRRPLGVRVRRRGVDEPGDALRGRLRRHRRRPRRTRPARPCSRRSRSAARPTAATGSRTTGTS